VRRLRGEFVFVQKPAELVATAQAIEPLLYAHRPFAYRRWLRERRLLGERAVRPMFVVVLRVDTDDTLEVAAAENQQPIEAFAPQTADPALGMRTRRGARTGARITRTPSARKISQRRA
jgi:hypothetical protein